MSAQEAIEQFLHGQIECWNNGDKEGFFEHYRRVSPAGLSIEYVGRPLPTHPGRSWKACGKTSSRVSEWRSRKPSSTARKPPATIAMRYATAVAVSKPSSCTVSRTAGCRCVISSRLDRASGGRWARPLFPKNQRFPPPRPEEG